MSIAISPLTVADSISHLSVSGVTIRDVDEIPDSVDMIYPIVFPQPSGFITAVQPETMSFGSNGTQKENFNYSLHYVFLFAPIGSDVNAFAPYTPMLTKLDLIVEAILNNDAVTGLVDMQLESIEGIGAIDDPSGNPYWGALFSLRCLEYAQ